MQLFYVPDLVADKLNLLPEDEALHCITVLRYRNGQELLLTDGKGNMYKAVISQIVKKQVSIEITDKLPGQPERKNKVHIAIAPTKNIERFEWFLEKATEIGIDIITPIITENSERKTIRFDRLKKVIVSAMKQSLKSNLPILNELTTFHNFVENSHAEQLFIAHCHSVQKSLLKDIYKINMDVLILVGPEGDFSATEVNMAEDKGYKAVSLGESRLRTETAGIVACHTINLLDQ